MTFRESDRDRVGSMLFGGETGGVVLKPNGA
jgi:hypothetical protein